MPLPSGSCKVLDVGGRYPGLYTVVGSYNGRGDYYSESQEHNIFFELDSSSSSSSGASGEGSDDDKDEDDDKTDGNNRRVLLDGERGGEGCNPFFYRCTAVQQPKSYTNSK